MFDPFLFFFFFLLCHILLELPKEITIVTLRRFTTPARDQARFLYSHEGSWDFEIYWDFCSFFGGVAGMDCKAFVFYKTSVLFGDSPSLSELSTQ